MRWFGPTDRAPFNTDDIARARTPVGALCSYCHEPVLDTEYGVLMPHVSLAADGRCSAEEQPLHEECYARQIVGSVAHQTGQCTCVNPNAEEHEIPGTRKRLAAKAAWLYARLRIKWNG